MLPPIFHSRDAFRHAFVDGLDAMLADEGLGVFILVLANATFAADIYPHLRERLAERFALLGERYRLAEAAGQALPDAPDDLAVFRRLLAVGFDELRLTEFRQVGPWQAQFNQLRSFRPARMTDAVVSELQRPFDAGGFHFNKPFLRKEILWEGRLLGRECRLLYNKFPFALLHGLLVIEPEANKPQWLAEADHHHVWELARRLGEGVPGWGFGYNAYGAYASVNHQHFQSFVADGAGYPVEHARWRHNGGGESYPVDCRVFDDAARAWRFIGDLHRRNLPYNLLYRPGRLYVSPRAFQGGYRHAAWTGGFAWSELAGACTLFEQADYQGLRAADIRQEMIKIRLQLPYQDADS